jgi:glucose-6-phosphate isomerase
VSFNIAVSGAAAAAVDRVVPQLVSDLVASRITAQDATLWGPEAEPESSRRLGWTEAVVVSSGLVDDITALRERLHANGVDRIVLCGMGGSSLAPEMITRTAGAPLVVLDATAPTQVIAALSESLSRTAVVVSSKSGSTAETDSQKRAFEKAFSDAGIDPVERIIIVTDPGSPLDLAARADGYRVFNADPNVGGRYSALTAFGLVPSGLAGVDIQALLAEASAVAGRLAVDKENNPGLILGAVMAGTRPLRDKLAIINDGSHILGFADWAEQLIAESTGKQGKGILPIVLDKEAPEIG